MSSADQLDWAIAHLTGAGIRTAEADVRALAAHSNDTSSFTALIERRASRVPLAHLLGQTSFRGLALSVGPGVFTPQPETASLVQWAVDALAGSSAPVVVDLCTGSGTVALAVANEVPGAVVHGVERDPAALAWARTNALRLTTGVQMHLGDAEHCLPELDGRVDLVVSNPPYVATHEGHIPDPEVVGHDPEMSLWAGEDGLDVIRLVERSAARLLKPGGLVAVEHSDRQGSSAPAVFVRTGSWLGVTDHVDHEGRPRFVTASLHVTTDADA